MKNTILTLIALTLIVSFISLLATLGLFGGGQGGSPSGGNVVYEYKALNGAQMDSIGFRAIAEEEGVPISEDGEISFPKEMAEKLIKTNLLPREISEVESDGGWEFVAVTADSVYIFRRAK
jgi:hypothetical protein